MAETGVPGLAAILWLVTALGFMAMRAWRQKTECREEWWFMVAVVAEAAFRRTGQAVWLVRAEAAFRTAAAASRQSTPAR